MKLSKRLTSTLGCLWLLAGNLLIVLQVVFLTLKLGGFVAWSWWVTLIPIFSVFGLPLAGIVLAVIVLVPKMLIAEIKRSIRVEAEARKYGMQRQPGESTAELKKRIIRRNMITGNYSRKDIKDAILEAFPSLGSCQIIIDNKAEEIVMIPRRAEKINGSTNLTQFEIRDVAQFAAPMIPKNYRLTVKNPEEKYGEENHNIAGS
jgi:uncharacterized membrane protein